MRKGRKIARILVPAAAAAAVLFFLWFAGAFLPRWCEWNNAEITEDLDGSGTQETVLLKNRHVTIQRGSETLYSFPLLWRVMDVFASDLDQDGKKELILITWKHGSYGRYRPFWVERDTPAFSQHVFVFRFEQDHVSAEWMSSDIGREIAQASMDEDGRLRLRERDGTETVWEWDFWGFSMYEKPEKQTALASAAQEVPEETQKVSESETQAVPEKKQTASDSAAQEVPEEAQTISESETQAVPEKKKTASDTAAQAEPKAETLSGPVPLTLTVSMIALGDNLAHESVNERSWNPQTNTFDYSPIYTEVKEKISSYDLAVVNQETVFTSNPELRSGYPQFVTPQSMGDALVDAGFDIILGATNHSYDNGIQGVEETVAFWEKYYPKIPLIGLHNTYPDDLYETVEKNGIRMAFFNYTESTNGLYLPPDYPGGADVLGDIIRDGQTGKDRLLAGLRAAEKDCDLSVCFLHAGEEYSTGPSSALRAFAEELIGEGADVLILSHPHVLQGFEKIRTDKKHEGIVWWSLGNFMSHQTYPETVLGGAAELMIEKKPGKKASVVEWDLLPTVCHFDSSETRVFFLEDYTEELAERHSINRESTQFTLESLENQAEQIIRNNP